MSDEAFGSGRGRSRRLPAGAGFVLRAFLGSRIALAVLGPATIGLFPPREVEGIAGWPTPPFPPISPLHAFATVWERFDALWFLRIADSGYRNGDGSAAFFPGFPIAVRAVSSLLGGHPLAAGLLVANLAFLGALLVIHALTAEERGAAAARSTVLALCFFPTSFFFLMPYSESLFLLSAGLAFLGVRRERHGLAAVGAFVAAATRSIGIVLVPAFLLEAALGMRRGGMRRAGGSVLVALSAAAGAGSYLAWWGTRTEWLAPLRFQANWQREPSWPWITVFDGVRAAAATFGTPNGGYWLLDVVICLLAVIAALWITPKIRPSYSVFMWGALLMPLSLAFPDRPLMSVPRFVLPLFPMMWGLVDLARWMRAPDWLLPTAGALLLGLLTALMVNGYYIF